MAKRYVRINFENKPSHDTPLSAENLNKLDKGIDDIDTELEDKLSKTTDLINNDTTGGATKVASAEVVKVHGQEIDTITNNLDVKTINLLPLITIEKPSYTVSSAMATIFGKSISMSIILTKDGAFTSSETGSSITLPVGYRPAKDERQPCMIHAGSTASWGYTAMGFCYVGTGGGMIVRDYTSSNSHNAILKLDFILS